MSDGNARFLTKVKGLTLYQALGRHSYASLGGALRELPDAVGLLSGAKNKKRRRTFEDLSPGERIMRRMGEKIVTEKLERGDLVATGRVFDGRKTGDRTIIDAELWHFLDVDFDDSCAKGGGLTFVGILVYDADLAKDLCSDNSPAGNGKGPDLLAQARSRIVPTNTPEADSDSGGARLKLSKSRHSASYRGAEFELTRQMTDLLECLADRVAVRGGIVKRREIEECLWGPSNVDKRAVADAVRRLKRRLKQRGPVGAELAKLIENRAAEGYLLNLGPEAIELCD